MNNPTKEQLYYFAKESNKIERICDSDRHELHAERLAIFLETPIDKLNICDLQMFVNHIEPQAFLRTDKSHMVTIGGRLAPNPEIAIILLSELLERIRTKKIGPHEAHCEYEYIHPFMDGNGRSGRALWLWQMIRDGWKFQLPFLQMYYYQTLDKYSVKRPRL